MTFDKLAEYLQRLEETASRNEITQILADLFKKISADEIDKVCYLLLGRVAPQYEGIEFNLAEKMVARALALAYKVEITALTQKYKKMGDLGDVAQQVASNQHSVARKKLSIERVFAVLKEIAQEGGQGSQKRKLEKMAGLLTQVDPLSAKYITRIPIGNLRLGFSDATMLDGLSVMEAGDKSLRKTIEAAYSVTADIGKIAQRVKEHGAKRLGSVHPEPGVPILASLAERLPTADKVAEKLAPKFAVEPKMDGFRTQVHVWKVGKVREVRLFSRNLENVTNMFPEIVEAVKKLDLDTAIFDGEAIGYNPKTGKFVPFQETVQRKRRHGIEEMARDLPLKVFVFDVLYLNGKTLLNAPFSARRQVLEKTLKKSNTIVLTDQEIVSSASGLRQAFDKYLGEGLEGVMAKKLDVGYQAGGRGYHWVKYKKHTESAKGTVGLADTIDCVLMGAYRGRGKRAEFGVGAFLLGVPGAAGKYYTISNLGTGLTDEQFRQVYKLVHKLEVEKQPFEYVLDKTVAPDIWVKPKVVLEILADEITLSPRHTAGRNGKGRGYSLRFPRLIRVRDDKDPDQATTVKEVEKLYKMQIGK